MCVNKEWLIARLKEVSTKWGIGIAAALVAMFLNAEEIGDWTQRLTAAAGLLAAWRLMVVKEERKGETP